MRTIVLHYHLFKNAGTSVDQILKRNFKEKWVTAEFQNSAQGNTADVEAWIAANPTAIAFSSHTMKGPLPRVDGVRVIPVMLLRDPISRIRSAYQFEQKQASDSWGAQLAKDHDLVGYVNARLDRKGDRQCRNFQTNRLASMMPGDAPELERAFASSKLINELGVLGRVEHFADAMTTLTARLANDFPDFDATVVRANTTSKSSASDMSPELTALLREVNRDDLELIKAA